MYILNLTQHEATPAQEADGVIDLPDEARQQLSGLLTFNSAPSRAEKDARADAIVAFALAQAEILPEFRAGLDRAMVGGAPFFMSALERALEDKGIEPLYAFSVRKSAEQVQPDGSVRKVNVFRHAGWA